MKQLLIMLLCSAAVLSADTKVVEGRMEFVFELRSGDQNLLDSFYEYENNSNSQKVVDRSPGSIRVKTVAKLDPFESEVPFPVDDRYRNGEFSDALDLTTSVSGVRIRKRNGEVLERKEFVEKTAMSDAERRFLYERAERMSAGAKLQHEAVEQVMREIRTQVSYRLDSSSNPVDVLRRGEAYCEGYANTGALLLQSLGIPARVVDSYIPPGHMWGYGQEGAGGYHAHVEVYYEDAGWVSYDPQATVHFVDPFHIVNYPRRRVKLVQLGETDNREILDRIVEPRNWDNFYQRRTAETQHNPLLVGKIYSREGRRVEDSFRSGEWVYRRIDGGEGEGIRILSNGSFAVSPREGESTARFFYRDGEGGWLEETVSFDEGKRRERSFRLDNESAGYTLLVGKGETLYLWFKDGGDRWRLDAMSPDERGTVFLLSDNGRWVVSRARQVTAPKYLLKTEKLRKGESYSIEELPPYFDPATSYVTGRIPTSFGGDLSVKLMRDDGARTDSIPLTAGGAFAAPRPSEEFELILLEGEALVGLKSTGPVNGANSHLQRVSEVGEEPRRSDFLEGTSRFLIRTSEPGSTIYLGERRGNRFGEYGRSEADRRGEALLFIDPGLLESKDLYVLYGSPRIKGRVPLSEAKNGVIDFTE